MSAVRGADVTDHFVRTGWSSEGSESVSRSSRQTTAAGACVAVTTWTAAHLCAYMQVRGSLCVMVQIWYAALSDDENMTVCFVGICTQVNVK